jgi:CubicO group peptidase (beta-lactamase class C family)
MTTDGEPGYTLPPAVHAAAEALVRAGHAPGLIVAAGHGGASDCLALGADAEGRALAPDTLFPVASVTKLATALAALRLIDQEALGLDDELAAHLPDASAARPGVTLRTLLCHTSGLPLDVAPRAAPYAAGLDWPHLAQACLATAPEAAPWTRVQYSNVGYGLLALVVERITGQGFAAALRALALGPLGVEGYLGEEPPRPPAVLADVRGQQRGTPLEPFNSPFWRSLALPWAGLVTTPAGALEKAPHWVPPAAGPASFGHSGASGSLAWADPASGVAWVILGARTADNGWLLRRSGDVSAAILAGRNP